MSFTHSSQKKNNNTILVSLNRSGSQFATRFISFKENKKSFGEFYQGWTFYMYEEFLKYDKPYVLKVAPWQQWMWNRVGKSETDYIILEPRDPLEKLTSTVLSYQIHPDHWNVRSEFEKHFSSNNIKAKFTRQIYDHVIGEYKSYLNWLSEPKSNIEYRFFPRSLMETNRDDMTLWDSEFDKIKHIENYEDVKDVSKNLYKMHEKLLKALDKLNYSSVIK